MTQKANPGISVVIPNFNQCVRLERTVKALLAQTYPSEKIEIIVVDNGSNDDSATMLQQYPVKMLSIANPKNPYVCRNAGIRAAEHAMIALNDASCIPEMTYLEELVKTRVASGADLVVGEIEFEIGEDPSLGEIVDSLHFMRNHEFENERKTFPTGSMFFHRSLPGEIGVFREDMRSGPDFLWTRKAFDAGKTVAVARNAKVLYAGTPFPTLFRKAHRDGRGHGIMARELGTFNWLTGIWRMRPPGPGYLQYVMRTRGRPEFRKKLLRIWIGLWAYRVVYNIGRLFPGSGH